ncbi:hypothetical protein H9I45_10290 [Polaribacter haliotis]|uniref:Uncharacterized protein n=1 Tax=Polaribacter haliotis TaxID=1888915 RepID=A0A7L8ACL7_9FLAO|nr:hypothetical protein [Polaribacter haliotis]QOD59740.1 hypothetical protein H9I45_10290 [Polaribacter haliotis]
MNHKTLNFQNKIINKPKLLFLIDAFGALITAFFLSVVLVELNVYFGTPTDILYILGAIAFLLFCYSISCSFFVKTNWKPFLRGIIIANTFYIFLSLVLLFTYFKTITSLAIIYFTLEFIIISYLIYLEYKVFLKIDKA